MLFSWIHSALQAPQPARRRGGLGSSHRRLGVFAEGLMIALAVDGVIFLKADARTIPQFEREGLAPFSYRSKDGMRTLTSYWRMPERLYDDPHELADWARRALESAKHSGARPKINRGGKPGRNQR